MAKATTTKTSTRPAAAAAAPAASKVATAAVAATAPVDDPIAKALAGFIATMKWADSTAEDVKTLVEGNLNGFAAHLRTELAGLLAQPAAPQTSPEPLPVAAPGETLVSVTGPKAGRWRRGHHFTPDAKVVSVDPVTLKAIQADPVLTVTPVATN